MNNKLFWAVIGLATISSFSLAIKNKPEATVNEYSAEYVDYPLSTKSQDRYLTEPTGGSVTLYEYSDFECPACVAYYSIVSELKDEYKSDVTFVFRHFPLTSLHPNAMTAHRIAEGSQTQGVFSEVHDLLFEQNQAWVQSSNPSDTIYELIQNSTIDVNIDKLKEDASAINTSKVIKAHMDSGQALGVDRTPTFFLNDEKIEPRSIDDFRLLIEEAIRNR